MALNSLIYKVNVTLSNFDIHYYDEFNLTMAKHPSENEERMMYRLIAFLYCGSEKLKFTKGLSETDEPELWEKGHSGEILHWVELGQPDEKRIRKACGKSERVSIFTFHHEKALTWVSKIKNKIDFSKVEIVLLNATDNGPIDKIAERTMRLSCTIEDNYLYLGNDLERVGIEVISFP